MTSYTEQAAELCKQAWLQPGTYIPNEDRPDVIWDTEQHTWNVCKTNGFFDPFADYGEAVRKLAALLTVADQYPPPNVVDAAQHIDQHLSDMVNNDILTVVRWVLARHEAEAQP